MGLASCDCKSIPLLCTCMCVCMREREKGRERDPEIRVCLENFKEAYQTLFSLSCLIFDTGLYPQPPSFSKCILSEEDYFLFFHLLRFYLLPMLLFQTQHFLYVYLTSSLSPAAPVSFSASSHVFITFYITRY